MAGGAKSRKCPRLVRLPSVEKIPAVRETLGRLAALEATNVRRIPRARRRERLLAGEDGLVQFAPVIALAGGRSDRRLTERDKHRGERCRRCVRPLPLEDRKLKIR
jgi:hypothetical protein